MPELAKVKKNHIHLERASLGLKGMRYIRYRSISQLSSTRLLLIAVLDTCWELKLEENM